MKRLMKMANDKNELQKSILKTLAYAEIFDFPLTSEETHRFLISGFSCSPEEIQRNLRDMRDMGELGEKEGYYFLEGKEEEIEERKKREIYSKEKLEKAKKITKYLKSIPFVKLIAVTGSLAVKNAKEEDDVDILIVTSAGRLWLTRLLVTTFLVLTNNYRRQKNIKNKICPNMYLDLNNLLVEPAFQNLFTAHEVAQIAPILNKEKTYERFIYENRWVKKYMGNMRWFGGYEGEEEKKRNAFWDTLEKLAFRFQYNLMKKKMTKEVVGEGFARFHPGDVSLKVLSEFAIRCKKWREEGEG